MILSWEQAQLAYTPLLADNYHWDIVDASFLFYQSVPFVQVPVPLIKRNYRTKADLPAEPIAQKLLESDGGAPPIDITASVAVPWATTVRANQAQWQLTNLDRPYAEDKNQGLYNQIEDPSIANLKANLYNFGLLIIKKFLSGLLAPAADDIAGVLANLNGYSNTVPAIAQGYNATIFGEQVEVLNSTIWGWSFAGGAIIVDDVGPLNRAFRKISGQPTAMIVPEAFMDAMEQNYNQRGAFMPESLFTMQTRFPSDPTQMRLATYKGVPIVVIENDVYTAAGHTVTTPGANNYPIFVIKASTRSPFDGVCIATSGQMLADNPEMVPAGAESVNLGTGLTFERIGRIADKTGVYRFKGRSLSMNAQIVVGEPRSCAVITGVQD